MASISKQTSKGLIEGEIYDDRFAPMAEAFLKNFEERDEVGAAVSITHEGKAVVDLWGGMANPKKNEPWTEETLSVAYSSTKGALSLCAHLLIEDGKLDPHAPVTELWPEYGAAGKDATTLQMMLDHTNGLPAYRAPVPDGALKDWDWATSTLAAQEPFFAPGTRSAYQGLTFAWTVGEMIRRASGQTAGDMFAARVAKPLGLEFWMGAPAEVGPRMARIFPQKFDPKAPISPFMHQLLREPTSIPHLFFSNTGGFNANDPTYWQAEFGSAGGVTNAKSLAKMYAPLAMGGALGETKLVSHDALTRMYVVTNATHDDATLRVPLRVAGGYMTSREARGNPFHGHYHMGRLAFGHPGAGGSVGFCDHEAGLSFGYVMNQMGSTPSLNERGQSLVDVAYTCLGWRKTPHHWRP